MDAPPSHRIPAPPPLLPELPGPPCSGTASGSDSAGRAGPLGPPLRAPDPTATPILSPEQTFAARWTPAVRGKVLARCKQSFPRDHHAAQEVAAAVARRGWEKLSTFHGHEEIKFLAWVMAITRTAVIDHCRERKRLAKWECQVKPAVWHSIASGTDLPAAEDQPGVPTLPQLLADASSTCLMSKQDLLLVQMRVCESQPGWKEVGRELGLNINAAKLCHADARSKLTVALFLLCPVCCGGPELIAEAFARARKRNALTAAEIKLFETMVIQRRPISRSTGRNNVLRTACSKVARCFRRGSAGTLGGAWSQPPA